MPIGIYGAVAPLTMPDLQSSTLLYSQSQLVTLPLFVTRHHRESPKCSAWLARVFMHKAHASAASTNVNLRMNVCTPNSLARHARKNQVADIFDFDQCRQVGFSLFSARPGPAPSATLRSSSRSACWSSPEDVGCGHDSRLRELTGHSSGESLD